MGGTEDRVRWGHCTLQDCPTHPLSGTSRTVLKPLVFALAALAGTAGGRTAALEPEFVRIGQPRNVADFTGLGRVDETFEIQRYEVTWAEYAAFLNAVAVEADPRDLWHPPMQHAPTGGLVREGEPGRWRYVVKPGQERLPAVWVTWHDAARYCNWLHQGAQPGGETEHGAYELRGGNPRGRIRTEGARFFLPNADEWYKAAYHEPDPARRGASRYWMYPTRSDHEPVPEEPPGGVNSGRFWNRTPTTNPAVPVGSYPATASGWGVADLAGNVWEWIETRQSARGASVRNVPSNCAATHPDPSYTGRSEGYPEVGFRVARRPWVPVLEETPASQAVRPGGTAEWHAVATGEAPLAIQWHLAGERWATGEVCHATLPVNTDRLGPFTVTVTNRHGRVESGPFFLSRADLAEGLALHFPGDATWLAKHAAEVRRHGTGGRSVPDRRGDEEGAVAFDGRGGLRLPFPAQPQGKAPRTLAAWVWTDATPPPQPAFAHSGMGFWDRRMFGLGVSEQQPYFWGGGPDLRSSLQVAPGTWNFLAVVYEPPWMVFWVNDESERVPTPELATIFSGGLWLGVDTANDGVDFHRYFQGALDEVWVYGRALGADELRWLRESR